MPIVHGLQDLDATRAPPCSRPRLSCPCRAARLVLLPKPDVKSSLPVLTSDWYFGSTLPSLMPRASAFGGRHALLDYEPNFFSLFIRIEDLPVLGNVAYASKPTQTMIAIKIANRNIERIMMVSPVVNVAHIVNTNANPVNEIAKPCLRLRWHFVNVSLDGRFCSASGSCQTSRCHEKSLAALFTICLLTAVATLRKKRTRRRSSIRRRLRSSSTN